MGISQLFFIDTVLSGLHLDKQNKQCDEQQYLRDANAAIHRIQPQFCISNNHHNNTMVFSMLAEKTSFNTDMCLDDTYKSK